jgi:hypothetical protein
MTTKADSLSLPFPDERKSARKIANFAATVRELGSTPMQAKIIEVSETGCRLADCRLEQGAEIWLQLPGREPMRATVIWTKGSRAGCRFYAPARGIASDRPRPATAPPARAVFGPRGFGKRI